MLFRRRKFISAVIFIGVAWLAVSSYMLHKKSEKRDSESGLSNPIGEWDDEGHIVTKNRLKNIDNTYHRYAENAKIPADIKRFDQHRDIIAGENELHFKAQEKYDYRGKESRQQAALPMDPAENEGNIDDNEELELEPSHRIKKNNNHEVEEMRQSNRGKANVNDQIDPKLSVKSSKDQKKLSKKAEQEEEDYKEDEEIEIHQDRVESTKLPIGQKYFDTESNNVGASKISWKYFQEFFQSTPLPTPRPRQWNGYGGTVSNRSKHIVWEGNSGVENILNSNVKRTSQPIQDNQRVPPDERMESLRRYSDSEKISRKISIRRKLADVRDIACTEVNYSDNLPDASIIIVFYNEAWTTLLRTVHSILDRSPDSLLTEILLVDDYSDIEELKQPLDDYLALLSKVRLIRSKHRLGVARSRQIGAQEARGTVLIFLDSHTECTIGWLQPLLNKIAENRKTVVTPVMDIIDDSTFKYKAFDLKSVNIGGFDWNLQFTWISIPEREKKRRSSEIDSIRTPTMSGGMFAIEKNWFNKLGGFDTGMDQWGSENLEMSFKIWMCGGSLETVPCSHVGHLFRRHASYKASEGSNPRKNQQRLAETWMDEYKQYYYDHIRSAHGQYGDISKRRQLRDELQCSTFGWYLKNIYPELFIPSEALASGRIMNKEKGFGDGARFDACIDSIVGANAYNKPISIWPCHGQGGNQEWMLTKFGEIRREDSCFDFAGGSSVVIYPCHGQGGNQQWSYLRDNTIVHTGTKLCLELSQDATSLTMGKCNKSSRQIWYWKLTKQSASVAAGVNSAVQEVNEDNNPAAADEPPEQEIAQEY